MNKEEDVHERYRIFDVIVTSLDKGKAFVRARQSEKPKILAPSELELLLSCQPFDTLLAHAEEYCRQRKQRGLAARKGLLGKLFRWLRRRVSPQDIKVPVGKKEVTRIRQQLQAWTEEGLLVAESEIQQEVRALSYLNRQDELNTEQISIVGIPTCGRPETLKRCLDSFTGNFTRHNRTPDILILDDSRSESVRQQNQSTLQELNNKYEGNLLYMSRRQRAEFGRAVAQVAKVAPDVMKFALMGHTSCNRSVGGCRNAFLLLSQGRLALQTDDDTICNISHPPTTIPQLKLTSDTSSDAYWFFDTFQEAIQAVDFLNQDFLRCHEKMLGKDLRNLITHFMDNGTDLDINDVQPSFLHKLEMDHVAVRMSLAGPIGDTCLFTDLHRLFLEGNSLQRLLYPAEQYPSRLATRQVIRSVKQPTLSDIPRCISMNFGVDNRSLLPPFMPIQRRGDGIFGDLLKKCFPGVCAGNLPYVLAHNPPEKRPRTLGEVFDLQQQIRVNDIIAALIHYFQGEGTIGNDPAENLRALSQFFMNLGSHSREDFHHRIYQICASITGDKIRWAEQYLAQKIDAPPYWVRSMQQYIEILRNALLSNDLLVPADIDNPTSVSRVDFRNIIFLFGQLLINWENIYQAMDQFSQEDIDKYATPIGH